MSKRLSEFLELYPAATASPAQALREQLFEQVNSLLEVSEGITDSIVRLEVQAHCLDVISALEQVIETYELEGRASVDLQ